MLFCILHSSRKVNHVLRNEVKEKTEKRFRKIEWRIQNEEESNVYVIDRCYGSEHVRRMRQQ